MKLKSMCECLPLLLLIGAGSASAQGPAAVDPAMPKPLAIGKNGALVMPNVNVVRIEAPATVAPKGLGMKAFVDRNGKLVNAPADDRAGSTDSLSVSTAGGSSPLQTVALPGGGGAVLVPAEMANFSMAQKAPDGKLLLSCVDDAHSARQLLQSKVPGAKENSRAKK